MATSIYNLDTKIQEQIIEAYKNNMSIREIQRNYGATRPSVSQFLEEKGIKKSKGNHYRKYFHDFDFFETIDTEEKAYWLGFMYSDGYIVASHEYGEDSFGLTLAMDSIDSIEKFKKSLKATNPIRYDNSPQKGQKLAKLVCTSQKTVDDLIDKGVYKQKSLILKPPKKVPQELLRHFIRGFFDGDGTITKYFSTGDNRVHFGISFTTTYEVAVWLQEVLGGRGSVFPDKRREHTWYYSIGGNRQVLKLCHYMYEEATIWMDRKYSRYQELLKMYDENQGSIV